MRPNPPLRILIVDDHPALREGLCTLLNQQADMEVCGEAVNGEEALLLFRLLQPDVTIMDLHMPVMDGITATRFICDEFPLACILAFTTEAEVDEIKDVLLASAKDCLIKGEAIGVLFRAIRLSCSPLPAAITEA